MKEKYEYKHFQDLKKEMNKIVHTLSKISKDDQNLKEHGAYVTRKGNAKNMYEVFLSPFAAGKSSLIHEYGHIRFQHLKYEELLIKQVEEKFRAAWPKIEKYINYDINSFDAKDTTFKSFLHIVQNHAMDMEVNSKLFDLDEKWRVNWEATVERFDTLKYFAEKESNSYLKKYLSDFLKKRKTNKKELLVQLVWPDDYGFPVKLFWHQYIDLMLQNPEKLLEKLAKELEEKNQLLTAVGKSPLRKKVADELDSNPLKNGISAADIQRVADSIDDLGDNEKMKPAVREEDFQSPDRETDNNAASIRNTLAKKLHCVPLGKEVAKFIQKYTIDEYKEFKTDFLYNYNRGKAGNVLRSKTVENINFYTGNCYIIVDTSGSIGSIQLNQAVSLFKDIKNRVGPKSRVVWFDTDVQRVDKLIAVKDAPRGASNDMAKAIDFVNKWSSKDDICFIISDFYDDCKAMANSIKKFKGRFYGIKWSVKSEAEKILDRATGKINKHSWNDEFCDELYSALKACDDYILVETTGR